MPQLAPSALRALLVRFLWRRLPDTVPPPSTRVKRDIAGTGGAIRQSERKLVRLSSLFLPWLDPYRIEPGSHHFEGAALEDGTLLRIADVQKVGHPFRPKWSIDRKALRILPGPSGTRPFPM